MSKCDLYFNVSTGRPMVEDKHIYRPSDKDIAKLTCVPKDIVQCVVPNIKLNKSTKDSFSEPICDLQDVWEQISLYSRALLRCAEQVESTRTVFCMSKATFDWFSYLDTFKNFQEIVLKRTCLCWYVCKYGEHTEFFKKCGCTTDTDVSQVAWRLKAIECTLKTDDYHRVQYMECLLKLANIPESSSEWLNNVF